MPRKRSASPDLFSQKPQPATPPPTVPIKDVREKLAKNAEPIKTPAEFIDYWNVTHPDETPHTPISGRTGKWLAELCEWAKIDPVDCVIGVSPHRKTMLIGNSPKADNAIAELILSRVVWGPAELAQFFLEACSSEDQAKIVREWCSATEEEFDEFLFNTEAALAEGEREEAMSVEESKAYIAEFLAREALDAPLAEG